MSIVEGFEIKRVSLANIGYYDCRFSVYAEIWLEDKFIGIYHAVSLERCIPAVVNPARARLHKSLSKVCADAETIICKVEDYLDELVDEKYQSECYRIGLG